MFKAEGNFGKSGDIGREFMENREITVLVVDNNPDNLISLKALVKEDFPDSRVFTADSGQQGIELAVSKDPDVILLDVIMPGMDGFETCRRIKADKKLKDTPVVFVTALRGDKESRVLALQCGAEGFISKPIDESELIAQIRAMLKIREANIYRRNEEKRLSGAAMEKAGDSNEKPGYGGKPEYFSKQDIADRFDVQGIIKKLSAIRSVKKVHGVFLWGMDDGTVAFEARVIVNDMLLSDTGVILAEIQRQLIPFEITHITIQFEV